jgi:hypothetical protein
MADEIILQDSGNLINLFQWGGVKKLNLYLFSTHLKIENAKNNKTIDDIAIKDIKDIKDRNEGYIIIETSKGKHYKIAWKNTDGASLLGKGVAKGQARETNDKSQEWVDAINKLREPSS